MEQQRRRGPICPRTLTVVAGLALALAGCGGTGSTGKVRPPAAVGPAGSSPSAPSSSAAAPPASTPPAATAVSVPAPAAPSVQVRTETVTKSLKFRTVTRKDPDLDQGEQRVVTAGVKGLQELTFRVTYLDGEETGRELAGRRTVKKPVDRVVAIGTRVAQAAGAGCDPNYSGGCVPIDSDVDCAGGSGNGPSYVEGPVTVVGSDIYRLDADHDGIGCE